AVVDPAHRDDAHRAAGPVHQFDGRRQHVLDAVAVDGVGVAAAHLHELVVAVAGQLGDRPDQSPGGSGVAVLVDEPHGSATGEACNADISAANARPINCSPSNARGAAASSISDMANPTRMRTQS